MDGWRIRAIARNVSLGLQDPGDLEAARAEGRVTRPLCRPGECTCRCVNCYPAPRPSTRRYAHQAEET